MAEPESTKATRPGGETRCAQLDESVLLSEIAFWREMIETRSGVMPPDAVERMHFALALAEQRLSERTEVHSQQAPGVVTDMRRARSRLR